MSCSSLWTMDKNWSGKEYKEYNNSWLFPPTIWNILFCKYIHENERRKRYFDKENQFETNFMTWSLWDNSAKWKELNDRIDNGTEETDKVLWALANLCVFNAKDKTFVADCIERFVEIDFPNSEYKDSQHIKDRFREVAQDIRALPKSCKYFVFKGTSCDDNVERWFYRKRLSSWKEIVCDIALIENEKVVGYTDNLAICKKASD